MLALIAALVLSADPLTEAREACERDLSACARVACWRAISASTRARFTASSSFERAAREAEEKAAYLVGEETAARQEAERRARCGRDYQRVRVGMAFKRVSDCAGPFDLVAEDQRGTVYQGSAGTVRVERGKVTRWIAR